MNRFQGGLALRCTGATVTRINWYVCSYHAFLSPHDPVDMKSSTLIFCGHQTMTCWCFLKHLNTSIFFAQWPHYSVNVSMKANNETETQETNKQRNKEKEREKWLFLFEFKQADMRFWSNLIVEVVVALVHLLQSEAPLVLHMDVRVELPLCRLHKLTHTNNTHKNSCYPFPRQTLFKANTKQQQDKAVTSKLTANKIKNKTLQTRNTVNNKGEE